MATKDPTIACVGDSALWCTGTRYEDKTPNLVHKMLTGSSDRKPDGDPIPPAQFRARGGATIGVDYPYRITHINNWLGDSDSTPDWKNALESKKNECETHIKKNGFNADACKVKIGPKLKPRQRAPIQLNQNAKYLDSNGSVYGFIKADAHPWYDYYSASDKTDINQLKWSIARDIGWHWPRIVDQLKQFPHKGSTKPTLDVPRDGSKTVKQFGGPVDTTPPYAEDVDVLMINGGTNDIALGWLNNPTKVRRKGIMAAVEKHCYHDQKTLLKKARKRFPNAIIFLVGYFPYASDWTWRKKAKQFLSAKAGAIGNIGAVVELATDNALNFARLQSYWMRKAVSEVARSDDGPGTVFVARGFGVVNSFDAPDPWAWGAPADETDDTGTWRAGACHAKHDADNAACIQASIGHPNRKGSTKTAEALVDRYHGYTDLDIRKPTAEWTDDRPVSIREACENYSLDPQQDGLRYCLSHRVVDSIKVDIKTGGSLKGLKSAPGGGTGPADPKNNVYLKVEPGRSGNGERFRLETEKNDFQKNSTDHFFIDPMMGRQSTADVGPVQESKAIGSIGMDAGVKEYQKHIKDDDPSHGPEHLTETDHPDLPYIRQPHWDSKRLRLGMIERISLDITDDSDAWDLERIDVELNGFIKRSKSVDHGGKGVSGSPEITIWSR